MKEIRYCKICTETYEIDHECSCVKLPKGCKSKIGECFVQNSDQSYKKSLNIVLYIVTGVCVIFVLLLLLAVLSSCNFSVNLIHSGKEASIDEVDEATPDVSPNLNLTAVPGV